MMYKKLAKIGLNKGVIVGILFMLLVIGAIVISVKMVRGVELTVSDSKFPMEHEVPSSIAETMLGENGVTLNKADGATLNPGTKEFTAKNGQVVKTEGMPPGTKIDGDTGDVTLPNNGATAKGANSASPISYDKANNKLSGGNVQNPTKTVTAETPTGNPAGMSCGSPSGEGGGGGDGGGSKTPKLDAALQAAQQAVSQAAQIAGPLKDVVKKQPNAPNIFYPQDSSGTVTTTVKDGAVANIEDKDKAVTLAQNDVKLPGNIKGSTLKDFTTGNSVIVVYGSVDAILVTPANKVTHVINDLAKGEPALTNIPSSSSDKNMIISFFLPFFRLIGFVDAASADVTGNVIMGSPAQEIKLKGYDLGVSGEDLFVAILKPFDKVNGQGSNLNIENGDVLISFKNMKTNYPRQVKSNDYFINEIRNDYDTDNVFMLVPGGQKGNYFEDARFRLTVGDAVVKNPLEGYENVNIPKTRLAMWKKAVEGDIIN